MTLLSFGCSFMFGCELPDNIRPTIYSRLSWPALLAQHHGWDYHCRAEPGSGNLRIAHNVLNHLDQDAVFVIGWTWGDRFDHVAAGDHWNTIRPADQDEYAEFYYRFLHSMMQDKLSSLLQMNFVAQELRRFKRSYIMTYQDASFLDDQHHTTPAILRLQKQILPHLRDFEGQTFLQWSQAKRYPISDLWHPLQQAHRAAADLIIQQAWV